MSWTGFEVWQLRDRFALPYGGRPPAFPGFLQVDALRASHSMLAEPDPCTRCLDGPFAHPLPASTGETDVFFTHMGYESVQGQRVQAAIGPESKVKGRVQSALAGKHSWKMAQERFDRRWGHFATLYHGFPGKGGHARPDAPGAFHPDRSNGVLRDGCLVTGCPLVLASGPMRD